MPQVDLTERLSIYAERRTIDLDAPAPTSVEVPESAPQLVGAGAARATKTTGPVKTAGATKASGGKKTTGARKTTGAKTATAAPKATAKRAASKPSTS